MLASQKSNLLFPRILVIFFSIFIFIIPCNAQNQNDSFKIQSNNIFKNIAPFFSPPAEFKNQLGNYRSPLKFYDGRTVKTKSDWRKRREEILSTWTKMMGAWPPLMKDQEMKILDSVRRDKFMQYTVQFYWTPNKQTKGYLLVPEGPGVTGK